MTKEIWKDIKGYEGLYQVSNLGRVKSLNRYVNSGLKNQKKVKKKGRVLRPANNIHGYLFVTLQKNRRKEIKTVHRLVAETFNPQQVNHIDGNKHNNNLNNLEWCTQKYNIQEAWRLGLAKQKKGKEHLQSKAVNQYDINGNFIKKWYSMMDIQRECGYYVSSICACCKGKRKTAHGYIWKYA